MANLVSLFPNSQPNNPNLLLQGADDFLNDYLIRSYVAQAAFQDLEKVTVDCETDSLDDLIADLTEASLFSQSKLVLVKNPYFLTGKAIPKKNQAKIKKQLEQLQEIFDHLDQLDDVVVMVASYEKLDRRKKITKLAEKKFNTVIAEVKSYDSDRFMRKLVKAEGYQFYPDAFTLLMERSDQVLDTALSNYLKLKMISPDKDFSRDLVDRNVDRSLAQNVFAILETALKGNYPEAVERLNGQIREGSYPVQILAVFISQVEFLLCVKTLARRRRSEKDIAQELGAHPYRVKLAMKNPIRLEKLQQMLGKLIQLDYGYKNGSYRDERFLEIFLLNC